MFLKKRKHTRIWLRVAIIVIITDLLLELAANDLNALFIFPFQAQVYLGWRF